MIIKINQSQSFCYGLHWNTSAISVTNKCLFLSFRVQWITIWLDRGIHNECVDNRTFQYLHTWWQVVYKFNGPDVLNYSLTQSKQVFRCLLIALLHCVIETKGAHGKKDCERRCKIKVMHVPTEFHHLDWGFVCCLRTVKWALYSWHSGICVHVKSQWVWIWTCVCNSKKLKELNAHWMDSNKPTIIMNILFGILQKLPKNTPAHNVAVLTL